MPSYMRTGPRGSGRAGHPLDDCLNQGLPAGTFSLPPSVTQRTAAVPSSLATRHPFGLDNTLRSINYNQRNQQARTNPTQRPVTLGNGRAGGTAVSARPATYGQVGAAVPRRAADSRKRRMSIMSDASYD